MKTLRSLWAFLSAIFCLAGTCLILVEVHSISPFADVGVLAGGTLIALAVCALFMAVEEHLRLKALARHMRHPSR